MEQQTYGGEGEEDANNFDPQAFFDSFAKAPNPDGGGVPSSIQADLQMSDSESEDEGAGFEEVAEGMGADMGQDDEDSSFNIDEFLQRKA